MLERISKKDNIAFQQIFNQIRQLKYRYVGTTPSENVSTVTKEAFAVINTLLSNMHSEYWIMFGNSHHKVYFAGSLGGKK